MTVNSGAIIAMLLLAATDAGPDTRTGTTVIATASARIIAAPARIDQGRLSMPDNAMPVPPRQRACPPADTADHRPVAPEPAPVPAPTTPDARCVLVAYDFE